MKSEIAAFKSFYPVQKKEPIMKKIVFLTLFLIASCEDSLDQDYNSNLVFVASEGTFGNSDGSIAVFSKNEKIQTVEAIGDVVQSLLVNGDNLFVTGGSGGGVLTSWIIGKTDRFKAAVVAKPVINWYSFVLYADNISFFYKYWFPGLPWDNLEEYMRRSPISYVGNVKTPTMLLTGEDDYRTPMAESEQFYAGLKLNNVESMLVRIPGASHGIAARPSNLIAKVNAITAWFDKYKK